MAGYLARKTAAAVAGACMALLVSIALASGAAAENHCLDAELNPVPCPQTTTTAPPSTTTTSTSTTTTAPPATPPSTSTTSTTSSTSTTTTAAPPPRQTTTTTVAQVAQATTSTTLLTLATVVVEPGTTTSAAQSVAATPEAAPPTTVLVAVTTTTSEPEPPEVTIADAEAVEEALGPIIVPITPGPPGSGGSTQIVWVILIGLNVMMIAAVTIRRRLRRTSMLGSFNGV